MGNIYRIQAHDSIMHRYFCIGFADFVLKGQSLLNYTNLFCPTKYERNIVLSAKNITNLKSLKYHLFKIKHDFVLVFVTSVEVKMKKYLGKKNQLKY